MHQKTRETLDDINRIEHDRRKGLADRVMQFIGREFRRQFPKNKLELIVGSDRVHVWIDDIVIYREYAEPDFTFIYDYLADVEEITDGYTRGRPEMLIIEPGTCKSQVAITALDNLNVDDKEHAQGEIDDILTAYLRDIGHVQVADASVRARERASW